MKTSVVISTYNGEKYIIQQLESIRRQTLIPDEVIICDDCSTDRTIEMIQQFISSYNLDKWMLIKNSFNIGFYKNFFLGLSKCCGDIIFLSDQDDIWDLNKVEFFLEEYKMDKKMMMVQSRFCLIDENGSTIKENENYHYIKSGHKCELTIQDMCKFAGSGYTMSFRKNVLKKVFDLDLDTRQDLFGFHDIVIGLVAISEGKCMLNRDVIDKHRIHNNNVTKRKGKSYVSNRTKTMQIDILKRRVEYFELLSENTDDRLKSNVFLDFSIFSKKRQMFIQKFSFQKFNYLLKYRNMYTTQCGVMADVLFSLGLEKIFCMLLK